MTRPQTTVLLYHQKDPILLLSDFQDERPFFSFMLYFWKLDSDMLSMPNFVPAFSFQGLRVCRPLQAAEGQQRHPLHHQAGHHLRHSQVSQALEKLYADPHTNIPRSAFPRILFA